MRTVLLVGFDSALHQSVSGIALHKVCGFRPATEHVFCLDWLVALYFCEFTRQQFPPEKSTSRYLAQTDMKDITPGAMKCPNRGAHALLH